VYVLIILLPLEYPLVRHEGPHLRGTIPTRTSGYNLNVKITQVFFFAIRFEPVSTPTLFGLRLDVHSLASDSSRMLFHTYRRSIDVPGVMYQSLPRRPQDSLALLTTESWNLVFADSRPCIHKSQSINREGHSSDDARKEIGKRVHKSLLTWIWTG
jgi:hypothetical protein